MKRRKKVILPLLTAVLLLLSVASVSFAAEKKTDAESAERQVVPKKVSKVSYKLNKNNSVILSWKAAKNATDYKVERRTKNTKGWSKWAVAKKSTAGKLSYKDKYAKSGKTYQYRVMAIRKENNKTQAASGYSSVCKVNVRKLKVLIVDYDTDDARRVKKQMTPCGFSVSRVSSIKKADPSKYDALVIPGGHNITPSKYGAKKVDPHTYGTDAKKDDLQIQAVKKFKKAKKPILGVCRGEQLVNVALGGTINQHIGTKKGDAKGWHKGYRDITIKKGSWLYSLLGSTKSVKHSHHQCVEKLGKGLVATQWDKKSGIIEGYEHKTLPIYGLQWHPDHMGKMGRKVFLSFKDICDNWMHRAE